MAAPIRPGGVPAGAVALPTDPVVLEQQRQILALQQQVLAMQIQQQQQATKHLEAKVPLVRVQLEELNRREAILDGQITELQRHINASKSTVSNAKMQLEKNRNKILSHALPSLDGLLKSQAAGYRISMNDSCKKKPAKSFTPDERKALENEIAEVRAIIDAVQQGTYAHHSVRGQLHFVNQIAEYEKAIRDLENLQHEKTELRNKKRDLENQIQTFLRQ